MEIDPSENSDWFFDYGLIEDVSTVPAGHFTEPPPPPPCIVWPSQALNGSSNASVEIDCSFGDSESLKEAGSRKSTGTPKMVPYDYWVLTGCGYAYRYGGTCARYADYMPDMANTFGYVMYDIVSVDETRERFNTKLETWIEALESKGFRISRIKIEYTECNFSNSNNGSRGEVKIEDQVLP
ncbi:hypothetical protein CsSME_00019454 [Camellia sinensis var. sinensis]